MRGSMHLIDRSATTLTTNEQTEKEKKQRTNLELGDLARVLFLVWFLFWEKEDDVQEACEQRRTDREAQRERARREGATKFFESKSFHWTTIDGTEKNRSSSFAFLSSFLRTCAHAPLVARANRTKRANAARSRRRRRGGRAMVFLFLEPAERVFVFSLFFFSSRVLSSFFFF